MDSDGNSEQRLERLPTYGDPKARPLVDLTDRDEVGALLDADGLR